MATGGDTVISIDAKNTCLRCSKPVTQKEGGLGCDLCEYWYHTKCEGVSKELYKALQQFDARNGGGRIHWYCARCENSVGGIIKTLNSVQIRQDKIENEVALVKSKQAEIDEILSEVKKNETKMMDEIAAVRDKQNKYDVEFPPLNRNNIAWEVKHPREGKKETSLKNQINNVLEEDKRKNNLVIKGVSEDLDDKTLIDKIFKELCPSSNIEIVEIARIGVKKENNRLIRVKLANHELKRTLLSKAKNLKDKTQFQDIYVMPDLTKTQLSEGKVLRDKLKFYRSNETTAEFKIEKGKVVKVEEGGKTVVFDPSA